MYWGCPTPRRPNLRGTTYSFRVKAANNIGDSNWTDISAEPATKSFKPTNLTFTGRYDSGLKVGVDRGDADENDTEFTGYTFKCKASSNWTFAAFVGANDSKTSFRSSEYRLALTNITAGTTYYMRVQTNRAIGDSS